MHRSLHSTSILLATLTVLLLPHYCHMPPMRRGHSFTAARQRDDADDGDGGANADAWAVRRAAQIDTRNLSPEEVIQAITANLTRCAASPEPPGAVRKSNLKMNWPIIIFRFAPAISPSGNFGVLLGFCLTHWGKPKNFPRIIN